MNKYLQYTLISLVFLLVGGAIYADTLSSQFVLDSKTRIENNPYLRISSLSPGTLSRAVFNAKASKNRPVPNLSFALNYYFGQYDVTYYHAVNILLHIITGILLFFLCESLLSLTYPGTDARNQRFLSLFAALLWLVHPVHTQSVTYIVQRSNSMAALFCITSLLMYIYGRRSKSAIQKTVSWTAAAAAFLLALGCKQNAAVLPFIVCLCEWYFFQDLSRKWLRDNLKYFLGVLLLFSAIAFIYLGPDPLAKLGSLRDFSEARFTLTERVLTQFRVVVYYLSLFFFPHPARLNLDYDFPLSHSLFDPITTLFSGLLLVGLMAAGIMTAKKYRLISFCIFWYFLNLAIESSIIPLAIIFEHRTYMPFMGVALLSVLLADRILKPLLPKVFLLGLAIAVGAVWTYQRNAAWEDAVTLWEDVVVKSPDKARPHNYLGLALQDGNRGEEAILHYKIAVAIEPGYKEALNNLGSALQELGQPDEAIQYLQSALEIDPDYADALNNLGVVLLERHQNAAAVQYFEAALKAGPDTAELRNNLGSALLKQGRTKQAINNFRVALEIAPAYSPAAVNLGAALSHQNNPDAAIQFFKTALKTNPDDVSALNHLGLAYIAKGNIADALEVFGRVLVRDPDNVEAHVNAGAGYLRLEQFPAAIFHLESALRLAPEMAQVHLNLGVGFLQSGHFQKGVFHLERALELEPENESARANLTRATALKQQAESRIRELREKIGAGSNDTRLYANLAELYNAMGNRKPAIDALRKALALDPKSDPLMNSLGNLYLADGQYPEALHIFERHLVQDPSFSLPYFNMARWSAKQGRTAEAGDWLEKAVSRGYSNWEQIKFDPDLQSIRGTTAYKILLKGH